MISFDVYTDGSYMKDELVKEEFILDPNNSHLIGSRGKVVHGGYVILDCKNNAPIRFCRINSVRDNLVKAWSQGGECLAAIAACQTCKVIMDALGKTQCHVTIYHDNMGVSEWIKPHGPKKWKVQSDCAKFYVSAMNQILNVGGLSLDFVKIKAHSGVLWNEVADALASGKSHSSIIGKVEVLVV